MKKLTQITLVLATALVTTAATAAHAGNGATLDQLKPMVGEWEARDADGKVMMSISVRETANGSSLIETQRHAGDHEMITVYSADGDDLMLTHFCAMGNAPRMVARKASADGRTIEFALRDITNLSAEGAGHMNALKYEYTDNDHFTQTWTWSENGQTEPKVFNFVRKN